MSSEQQMKRRELFTRLLRAPRPPFPTNTAVIEELPEPQRGLARLSTRLQPGPGPGSFGGRALLARGVEWPAWRGRPLTFLARVGGLSLFYEAETCPSGFEPAHAGCGRALLDSGSSLMEASGPALPARRAGASSARELVLPRVYAAAVEELDLDPQEREAWERTRERLAAEQGTVLGDRLEGFHPLHRILGYPDDTHGDMPLICELCSRGEDAFGGRPWLHPRAAEREAASRRWELLAQLSSDEQLGWSWGKRRLYYWVEREALARRDLSRVWTILR
jgi:Domain of unknown function (DUF1963)